ncbi:GspE/PulE family protein [Iodobacter fluviatilis]|uniref:General secretion pathway protein E n=1 Tax=Iodobacter fluviatilis TaxID=537 RepID=A0A377Q4G0_9NEIS|nr:GspE/PulE family protein [Iodobacter fluviatilis]TCU90621.1 general secretion pathway protein E [Iodobacter fluviatilis]STQ89648.1 Type II traffic warden ATPase [Iodobacter fluviatilis]
MTDAKWTPATEAAPLPRLSLELIQTLRQDQAPLAPRLQHVLQLSDADYGEALSHFLGLPFLSMDELSALSPRYDLLPYGEAVARQCLLLDGTDGLCMVLADPFDAALRNWLRQRLTVSYQTAFAHHQALRTYLDQFETSHRAMDQLGVGEQSEVNQDGIVEISLATLAADKKPVVKLVNSTLYDALKAKASDVHMESTPNGLTIKYRIDGVLLHIGGANGLETAEQVISRIKVLADLDISERRVPQDGRFKARINGREVDFRVSIMPSIYGEDAVLRVLDKQNGGDAFKQLRLDILGFDDGTMGRIRSLAREPYGLLLVTGPTGSGKSTTLYATLSEINTGEEKIITIEDPVEYQLPGVLQIPVNDKKGLSFARGLRSVLRHDPDKILVGEIRDGETANIAVQAALTGHLVLTSVHANNVFSVLDRFIHMGVEPNSFVDALIGVVAQRLIRKICLHCVVDDEPDEELLATSGLRSEIVKGWRFKKGVGCKACRNTGYQGRKAIAEVLRLNDELKQAIASRAPAVELKQLAARFGFLSMRQQALAVVASGETTLQEINRVTFVD